MNQISCAPATKDIELAECLAKLRGEKKNNNYNNNDYNTFPPFLSPPSQPPTPLWLPPDGGDGESDDDDDDNRNFTPTQRFLPNQPQRTAVAVGPNNTGMSMP